MEKLSMILQNQGLPTSHFEIPELLTDAEKTEVIDWVIFQAKKNLLFRLLDKGMSQESAELAIAKKEWAKDIDLAGELRKANNRKYYKLEQEKLEAKQKAAERDARAALLAEWDAKKFYETMKQYFIARNGTFKAQGWNRDFIKAVCLYMAKDARFEAEMGLSLNKGLMIVGTAGLGKTETIRSVASNPLRPVRVISILEIAERVKESGECNLPDVPTLIDDVGSEPECINYYGTKINWFKDFIEGYYLRNSCFYGLMVTTNIDGQEIENRYGYRVRSRCKDMFNVIRLEGADLRGKKNGGN